MIDKQATAFLKPLIDRIAIGLVRAGVSANTLTFAAFGIGMAAAVAIGLEWFLTGAAAIGLSRLLDALDGAVARRTLATDRGGFLDIVLDFVFYAAVPLGFAFADPARNALAAAALLAAFIGTGSSFLAFAAIAAKRGLASNDYPDKSFYFLGGLTEAFETIVFFIAMCFWPAQFALLAWIFAALCVVTTATRIVWGWRTFG